MTGAVLAVVLVVCGAIQHCAAQPAPTTQTQPTSRPATRPTTTAATGPGESLNWYVPRNPDPDRKATIGSLDPRTGYQFQVEVVGRYASIRTLKLSNYFTNVSDKQRFHADPDAYIKHIEETPGASDGHYTLLDHVQQGANRHLPLATQSVRIKVDGEKTSTVFPTADRWHFGKIKKSKDGKWESVSFKCYLLRGPTNEDADKNHVLTLTKTYTIWKEDYTIQVDLTAKNLSSKALTLTIDQRGPTGAPLESHRADERFAVCGQLPKDGKVKIRIDKKTKLTKKEISTPVSLGTTAGGADSPPVLWIGQGNKFFASMLYLRPAVTGRLNAANYNAKAYYLAAAYESPDGDSLTHVTGLEIPALRVAPNETKTLTFDLFGGPKKRAIFTDKDNKFFKQQYEDLGYVGAINISTCCGWCTFDWLTFGMMWLLNVFAGVAFENYGLAIFMLVVLVRVVLHPLTRRGQMSMAKTQKEMKKVQPLQAKLKEKYANDKETLQKETMKLYKELGVNPMSGMMGCLPMMLQMPIWIALYSGLNAAVELRHAAFLPVWITDLAAPDALFAFGTDIWLIGKTFNLLPILVGIAMFFQSKLNPATATATTPEQETQQKMMRYMMPAMMLVIFYNMPSGLSLYVMTSMSVGVIEQILIRKHIREKEAAEAASVTTIKVGGKGFRESRPKKSKENWTKKPW